MAFDWKSLIRTVAPTLATALGGPLAGAATAAVSNALIGKPDGSEAELAAAAVGASPDLLQKLREAENAFKVRMKELDIDLEKIGAADRASAREREIALATGGDHTTRNLAYMALGLFTAVLGAQFIIGAHPTWSIDSDAQRTIDITTGILFAWVMAVKDYFFGSSQGDVHKDKTLRRIAESE